MSDPMECRACDGTGWVEGGTAIRTPCGRCGGLGILSDLVHRVPASPPATGKCPTCGGDGIFATPNRFGEPENPQPCSDCEGTGWVSASPRARTHDADCAIAEVGARHGCTCSPRENRGWGCGCVPDFEHTACPLHAKSDVYLIPAPVASGTPKCLSYRAGHGMCDVCSIGGDCSAVSPAPAAPGVELDFAAARQAALDYDEAHDDGSAVRDFNEVFRDHLNAQVRALVDAAVKAERERLVCGFEGIKARDYAPLLAAVEEWQEARKAYELELNRKDYTPKGRDAFYHAQGSLIAAESALAAWRNK